MKGFTLIELLTTLVLLAVILILVTPNFGEALERRTLQRAGENVLSAIKLARSEALKQEKTVAIIFTKVGSGWCYGIDDDTTSACNCNTAPANCTLNGASKVFNNGLAGTESPFKDITLGSSQFIYFTSAYGKATVGRTVSLSSSSGLRANVIVEQVGRVRIQSDLPGYTAIP